MATITVTTAADVVAGDGLRSLREAVTLANATAAADTIVFASALEGRTLTLTQGELVLTQDVTIDGDGNNDGKEITLSGGNLSRILHAAGDGTDATLRDLTLTQGHTGGAGESGGAILGDAGTSLRLEHATLSGNHTSGDRATGGAISGDSILLHHSSLTSNGTTGYFFGNGPESTYGLPSGGAVYGHDVTLISSVVSNNSASGFLALGGGIFGGRVALVDSVLNANHSVGAGGGVFGYDVTITSSVVSGNTTSGIYARGGGIFGDRVSLVDSVVSANHSAAAGGGVYGIYVTLTGSHVDGNSSSGYGGGGVYGNSSVISISSSITDNSTTRDGGGVRGSQVTLDNTTVTGNKATVDGYYGSNTGGGGVSGSIVNLHNSTVTGNIVQGLYADGGGVSSGHLNIANTIVAGNSAVHGIAADVAATGMLSNGHNIFGSDVGGAIDGDREGIASSLLFAALDPVTGGGRLSPAGIVALRNSVTNPALSAGDPLTSLLTDQLGHARPSPAGSIPDVGATELSQTLSTHPSPNNDVLTGSASAETIAGGSGSDLIRGLAGNDRLRGEGGNDVLDGGSGNDRLDGGDGIDLARFGGSTAVTVDLVAGTARHGTETDTLSSIQGAIGSSAADAFIGDGGPNWFHGGGGRDVATGGAGIDVFDYDSTSDSRPGGADRDVITDFSPGFDKIDLSGIDADTGIPGNQAFTWVADAAFTGAGQVGFVVSGEDWIVQASTDGDATAEFQIRLAHGSVNGASDFFL